MRSAVHGLFALALLSVGAPPARADPALTVCLDETIPPLSFKQGEEAGGFDLAVSGAVAKRLGRKLVVQWFEGGRDSDDRTDLQANALLSDGRCQLVAGYALIADALGKPDADRSKLPTYEGAKADDRRRWVRLGSLIATRGYRFEPLTVVLGPKAAEHTVHRLGDLAGLKLGVEEATLADAVLRAYGGGQFIDQTTHVVPGHGLLDGLASGAYDAVLVELHDFDAYRQRHPDTRLRASGYYHSLGFNMGFVGLATEAALVGKVGSILSEMLATDELKELALETHVTYLPPRSPDVLVAIPRAALSKD
ncbi:MAG: transporter substrate-binding domain-containing protein [Pseudomonadota bacterium]|nr:transporter substrate-binding domain-containing protein [Pseudomonadota bacterium]